MGIAVYEIIGFLLVYFVVLAFRFRPVLVATIASIVPLLVACSFGVALMSAKIKQARVEKLIADLENFKRRTGQYPSSINEVTNDHNSGLDINDSYEVTNSGFILRYHLATLAIGHWYSTDGGWGHTDD
jgi:hypothetical protein